MLHIMPQTVLRKSTIFALDIQDTIILNNIEKFKDLLTSRNEVSENDKYNLVYGACVNNNNQTFLHCLIFDLNLREDMIASQYIPDEVKVLFIQKQAEELSKELKVNIDKNNKKLKI